MSDWDSLPGLLALSPEDQNAFRAHINQLAHNFWGRALSEGMTPEQARRFYMHESHGLAGKYDPGPTSIMQALPQVPPGAQRLEHEMLQDQWRMTNDLGDVYRQLWEQGQLALGG